MYANKSYLIDVDPQDSIIIDTPQIQNTGKMYPLTRVR